VGHVRGSARLQFSGHADREFAQRKRWHGVSFIGAPGVPCLGVLLAAVAASEEGPPQASSLCFGVTGRGPRGRSAGRLRDVKSITPRIASNAMQNATRTHAPRMDGGPCLVNPRICPAKDLRSGVASLTDSGMLLASGAVREATGWPPARIKESSWAASARASHCARSQSRVDAEGTLIPMAPRSSLAAPVRSSGFLVIGAARRRGFASKAARGLRVNIAPERTPAPRSEDEWMPKATD
jgi:hypothetical protein